MPTFRKVAMAAGGKMAYIEQHLMKDTVPKFETIFNKVGAIRKATNALDSYAKTLLQANKSLKPVLRSPDCPTWVKDIVQRRKVKKVKKSRKSREVEEVPIMGGTIEAGQVKIDNQATEAPEVGKSMKKAKKAKKAKKEEVPSTPSSKRRKRRRNKGKTSLNATVESMNVKEHIIENVHEKGRGSAPPQVATTLDGQEEGQKAGHECEEMVKSVNGKGMIENIDEMGRGSPLPQVATTQHCEADDTTVTLSGHFTSDGKSSNLILTFSCKY